jgi:hypothetical protein
LHRRIALITGWGGVEEVREDSEETVTKALIEEANAVRGGKQHKI